MTQEKKENKVSVMQKIIILAMASIILSSGCKARPAREIFNTKESVSKEPQVEVYAKNLEVPWSMAFTPDKRMLVTERAGRIRVIDKNGVLQAKPLATVSDVISKGESGLLGLALHPDYAKNKWLYICYTKKSGEQLIEVVKRFKESPEGIIDEKIIVNNIPAHTNHDGCRLKFGPDNKLYITTGDASNRELAQKLDSLAGKTLRLNDDGSVPNDNPFVGKKNARAEIWSFGHRNAQGLAWQPQTNLMFQTEHGPSGFDGPGGGDEINIVERGKNYGWPLIHHTMAQKNLESPLLEYTPAIAPAGATFYTGTLIPKWHNNFFFVNLRGQKIIRVQLDGRKVLATEELYHKSYGRIRDIIEGPDGALYFATSNKDGRGNPNSEDDRIMRIKE